MCCPQAILDNTLLDPICGLQQLPTEDGVDANRLLVSALTCEGLGSCQLPFWEEKAEWTKSVAFLGPTRVLSSGETGGPGVAVICSPGAEPWSHKLDGTLKRQFWEIMEAECSGMRVRNSWGYSPLRILYFYGFYCQVLTVWIWERSPQGSSSGKGRIIFVRRPWELSIVNAYPGEKALPELMPLGEGHSSPSSPWTSFLTREGREGKALPLEKHPWRPQPRYRPTERPRLTVKLESSSLAHPLYSPSPTVTVVSWESSRLWGGVWGKARVKKGHKTKDAGGMESLCLSETENNKNNTINLKIK